MNIRNNEKTEKKVRLDTFRHVKRFLQSVINDYNNDIITDLKAKTLSTLLNTYTKLLDAEKLQTTISNDNELNYFINKANEYLKTSHKELLISNSINENLTTDQLLEQIDEFKRILTK